jgi:anaphase-promoting complex subunit 1
MFERLFARLGAATHRFEAVVAMHECGFTPQILETLPEAILTALQDVISICQPNPPLSWPDDLLAFVGRTDMSGVLNPSKTWRARSSDTKVGVGNASMPKHLLTPFQVPSHESKWDVRMLCQHLDGLNDHVEDAGAAERQAVVRSLFREDRRLNEAQSLLSTVKHRIVRLEPLPEWTEAEYLEKQKELVTTVATSTLAIPAGRGLLHFALRYPLLTQKFQIPGFNLTCIVKPANNTVSVDKSMFPEEKINWAFFHQGVSGGLAISPHAKGIDTSWILYNKPGQDLSNRHAGFLLALGLNGHLKSVAKWVAFKYLTPKHTMTTIGLLLGLAASYIGTMDALMTRLLSVHVTRMLPRGAADLNLSTATQTSGIMGIGLVYCNSQHRRMSEIMLSEIEHISVEEEEEEGSVRDESYRLAAGFALGFINLGKGGDLRGLRDMQLTEKLLTMATATKRVELVHVLDWSAAGAVVAIALIYLKSEDQIVARKIDVPDTLLQFDYVRPDILLLRTVAKNLILWNEVDPTFEWIKNSLPAADRERYQLIGVSKLQSRDLPFFSILAGLCFALGLRFAGSANARVRDLLVHYLDQFIRIVRIPVSGYDSELARNNACMCMDLVALSCATVMAGTGDIIVLRRLRALHGRDDATTSYGSHLAAHLAIGALFLGSGTATFGTSDLAVASLFVAFYPIFPANVQDNRSHLQAFRHFWVLATEPRCLVTKDLVTGRPLTVPILIRLQPNSPSAIAAASQTALEEGPTNREPVILRRQTPCLLPPLDDIARVETDAKALGYWDLAIPFGESPHLKEDFRKNQTVYLRRRPADEGPFPATVRALADSSSSGAISRTAGGGVLSGETTENAAVREPPLEWVFTLPSLADVSRAERDAVLDRFGTVGDGGLGDGEGAGTAVDARLVLRSGLDDGGCWSRDRLLGLRLLFEWAERRGVFAKGGRGGGGGGDVVAEKQVETGKGRRGKEKGKKAASGRGKKKVSLGGAQHEIGVAELQKEGRDVGPVEASWWLRDSVIEELKGRTWLAGRQ